MYRLIYHDVNKTYSIGNATGPAPSIPGYTVIDGDADYILVQGEASGLNLRDAVSFFESSMIPIVTTQGIAIRTREILKLVRLDIIAYTIAENPELENDPVIEEAYYDLFALMATGTFQEVYTYIDLDLPAKIDDTYVFASVVSAAKSLLEPYI